MSVDAPQFSVIVVPLVVYDSVPGTLGGVVSGVLPPGP